MIWDYIKIAKKFVLDLIFPVFCLNCKQEGEIICSGCQDILSFIPPQCFVCGKLVWRNNFRERYFDLSGRTCLICRRQSHIFAFWSPFSFKERIIREAVHNLKYGRQKDIGRILGDIIFEYLKKYSIYPEKNGIVIPIPLHRGRLAERGFNQAEIIGQILARKLNLEFEKRILRRIKHTQSQTELTRELRKNNVAGVFQVKKREFIKDRIVFLLDDVKTTGVTLEEAAGVLRGAGAKRIIAITVAH